MDLGHALLAGAVLLGAGCKHHPADEQAKREPSEIASAPTSAARERSTSELVFRGLQPLPLELEVPESATVSVVDGGPMAMGHSFVVFVDSISFVINASPARMPYPNVVADPHDLPATMAELEAHVAKPPVDVQSFTREDKTPDGWILEGTMKDAEPTKQGYGIWVRRTIGGSAWDCLDQGGPDTERPEIERLCRSLRAARP